MNHQYQRHGERNGNAKLTTEKVEAIREAVRNRDKLQREARRLQAEAKVKFEAARLLANPRLAKRFGISVKHLGSVMYRNWQHVR